MNLDWSQRSKVSPTQLFKAVDLAQDCRCQMISPRCASCQVPTCERSHGQSAPQMPMQHTAAWFQKGSYQSHHKSLWVLWSHLRKDATSIKGHGYRSKKLLVAPGITTRSKDATLLVTPKLREDIHVYVWRQIHKRRFVWHRLLQVRSSNWI